MNAQTSFTRSELSGLSTFGTIPNVISGIPKIGYTEFAVRSYGGAYVMENGKFTPIANTNDCYDIADLRAHLFELNR